MTKSHDITVAYGDGIGPEIMEATLFILAEARAKLNIEVIEVGKAYYGRGFSTGIPPQAWESLHRTKILLKAPITTPQGGGYKSLNVTIRKKLELFANIRPCISYNPFVDSLQDNMDLVIIRENEEDLYSGIEYRQSLDTYHAIKLITASGSARIAKYAFEYARKNNRKKITCMSKDNILKMTDGIFHKAFNLVGKDYPEIEQDHYIIDIGSARVASCPQGFDVIVTENLYGDIISDIAAEMCGSVGLAGSSNIGEDFAMFEAIHGSAPDIAGQNIANPSGLLNGAIMMLVHLGEYSTAETIQNAWLKTIEDGLHTGDIFSKKSKEKLGTKEFAQAVTDRLGEKPHILKPAKYEKPSQGFTKNTKNYKTKKVKKTLIGVDIFITHNDIPKLAKTLQDLTDADYSLAVISSKGLKIWPKDQDMAEQLNNTDLKTENISPSDTLRCRFLTEKNELAKDIPAKILTKLIEFDVLKTENLFTFGDENELGFTLSQGE